MRPEIATGSDPQRRVGGEEKWRRTAAVIAAITRMSTMLYCRCAPRANSVPTGIGIRSTTHTRSSAKERLLSSERVAPRTPTRLRAVTIGYRVAAQKWLPHLELKRFVALRLTLARCCAQRFPGARRQLGDRLRVFQIARQFDAQPDLQLENDIRDGQLIDAEIGKIRIARYVVCFGIQDTQDYVNDESFHQIFDHAPDPPVASFNQSKRRLRRKPGNLSLFA